MASASFIPAVINTQAVLMQLRMASKSAATGVSQNPILVDLAPGPAVAVAQDGSALQRAVSIAAFPPDGALTNLQASMYI